MLRSGRSNKGASSKGAAPEEAAPLRVGNFRQTARPLRAYATPSPRSSHGLLAGARVLVVDDEPHIRRLLRTALEDDGSEVREAADGVEALAVARVWLPDAIVLDLLMPMMNGWQFADAYARQQERADGRRAPIIAVTAAGPGAVRSAEALSAITAVLAKPLDLDELTELLDLHVGGERPV